METLTNGTHKVEFKRTSNKKRMWVIDSKGSKKTVSIEQAHNIWRNYRVNGYFCTK